MITPTEPVAKMIPEAISRPTDMFSMDQLRLGDHDIAIIGLSHHPNDRDKVPGDWKQRLTGLITPQTLLFLEYFPPELEGTIYNVPVLGKLAREYSDSQGVSDVFGFCADLAKEKGIRVAVADIANNAFFNVYEFGQVLPPFVAGPGIISLHNAMQELGFPQIAAIEKMKPYMPYVDDARNVYTAKGIAQTAARCDVDTNIVYLGSPQHAVEISRMLKSEETVVEKLKFLSYQAFMPGLDKKIRIYRPSDSGWVKESSLRIK